MSTEVVLYTHTAPIELYNEIAQRYHQQNFVHDGTQAHCEYIDPETEKIVMENHWNTATGYDRWVLLDPAAELWFLANAPADAEIRRKP